VRTGRWAIVVALLALGGGPAPASDLSGPARLVDGDTIEVAGQSVRLHGIDAPETAQQCFDGAGRPFPCGRDATAALGALISGRDVTCTGHKHDRYGRIIATCRAGGVELNAEMVRLGHAIV